MVLPKTPDAFTKHLPSPAQALLKKQFGALPLHELSKASSELTQPGRKLETFETRPMLLRSEDESVEQTIEVAVESESDDGDEAELRLALRIYRAGRPIPLPFVPTIACKMKMDDEVWRLDEIAVNLRVPLSDEDFLEPLQERFGASATQMSEANALRQLRTLNTAEVSYASTFANLGFTCTLSDLGGSGESSANAARLIDDQLATADTGSYRFSLSDCSGSPVDHFRAVAAPVSADAGLRAFCSDESGVIRYAEDGDASSCLRNGQPLP